MADKKLINDCANMDITHTVDIDESFFIFPTEKDFYIDNVPLTYLENLNKQLNIKKDTRDVDLKFFIENPFSNEPGFHKDDRAFVLGLSSLQEGTGGSYVIDDGDTVLFPIDKIEEEESEFEILGRKYNSFSDYVKKNSYFPTSSNEVNTKHVTYPKESFALRFLGIDAPEIAHKRKITNKNLFKFKEISYAEAKKDKCLVDTYWCKKNNIKDDDKITVAIQKDWKDAKWSQVIDNEYIYKDETISQTEKATEQGYKAVDSLYSILGKAKDIKIVIDAKSLSRQSIPNENKTYIDYVTDYINPAEQKAETKAFNAPGQDMYKRFLGTMYALIPIENGEDVWINVSKYLMSQYDEMIVRPEYSNNYLENENGSFVSDVFNINSYYDYKNKKIEKYLKDIKESDYKDKNNIQEQITNTKLEDLKEYTVMIGDCLLMVPPTSIRFVSQTNNERKPLLRANGAMTKGGHKTERVLELMLYFNEQGINGIPYQSTLPNGKKITYYMNGLRALISQFKFTPFLPIENNYINNILEIEAVSLLNVQITTMPAYPKCVAVKLQLEEFNYRIYMPEIPPSTDDNLSSNMFANTINYGLMRWYYQRAIIRGEELKKLEYNSLEYNKKTIGNKTSLIPMDFLTSNIEFYIIDKQFLDEQLNIKLKAEQATMAPVPKIDAKDQTYMNNLSNIITSIDAANNSNEISNIINKINSSQLLIDGFPTEKDMDLNLSTISTKDTNNNNFNKTLLYPLFDKINDTLTNSKLNGVQILSSDTKISSTNKNFYFNIYLDIAPTTTVSDNASIESIVTIITKQYPDIKKDDILKNGKIKLQYVIDFNKTKPQFNFNSNCPGYKFLSYCGKNKPTNELEKESKELDNVINSQNELLSRKQNIDYESEQSLHFVKYPLENLRITSMSCVFGNNFTKFNLEAIDGSAPQFSGGQDSIIEIDIQTLDETSAKLLTHLPKMSAQYVNKYRKVLKSWPVKIHSEITKFLSINEIMVESVSCDTVPNYPGLYNIHMRLVSIDRTLRNRESLKKAEVASNAGLNQGQYKVKLNNKTFFDLKDSLSKAEIYPDLELPTLKELEDNGFKLMNYYNLQNMRTYPDPDFYFVYNHILCHEIFRDMILSFFSDKFYKEHKGFKLQDRNGAEVDLGIKNNDNVFEIKNKNDIYKKNEENIKNSEDQIKKIKEESGKQENKNYETKDNNSIFYLINLMYKGNGWHIGDKVKSIFKEKKLLDKNDKNKIFIDINNQLKKNKTNIISSINSILKKGIVANEQYNKGNKYFNQWNNKFFKYNKQNQINAINQEIMYHCDKIFSKNEYKVILENFNNNNFDSFSTGIAKLLTAAAFSVSSNSDNLQLFRCNGTELLREDNGYVVPNCICKDGQSIYYTKSVEDSIKNGTDFGIFRITRYTKKELSKIFNIETNINFAFLDPYYRKQQEMYGNDCAEIVYYKQALLISPSFAAEAFIRNCLVWLKKLLEDDVLPSARTYIADNLKDIFKNAKNNSVDYSDLYHPNAGFEPKVRVNKAKDESEKMLNTIIKSLKKSDTPEGLGIFLAPIVLLIVNNDISIYNQILNRDYDSLNAMMFAVLQPSINTDNKSYEIYKRFILGLQKTKFIDNINEQVKTTQNIGEIMSFPIGEKLSIARSEDPKYYIRDSFLDMIQNDKRGRMCRAFPTYYMMFVDEGRNIGYWKLHDNFYNMSSISEIQVAKSRKIPIDTAQITMTNMFNSYTNPGDEKELYEYNFKDVFNSIFSPRTYFLKEELNRLNAEPVEFASMKPGIRITLRMGYGADASTLPTLFNGVISEVGTGEMIQLVAQSDASEIVSPLMTSSEKADNLVEEDKFGSSMRAFFKTGATPKTILSSVLTAKGGIIKQLVNKVSKNLLYNDNAYGIVHFGDMHFKDIFPNGEVTQNIYEATSTASWSNDLRELYDLEGPPKISFNAQGKSFYDILNICVSSQPDFITSIVPFGLRSTVFLGAPRFYYAYDYVKVKDDSFSIKEKRKPFQQYHIYTSYSDIIANSIIASSKDMKTAAIGTYNSENTIWKGGSTQKTLDPIMVDFDIYPEYQKTMYYDTQYLSRGVVSGKLIPYLNKLTDTLADTEGHVQGGKNIAWRMTAHALKNSVKDMYQGELIIIGDPSVKPYDRIMINDIYNNINGSCDVEAVVHNFSVENGYTTSIYPDCTCAVDDRHLQASLGFANEAAFAAIKTYSFIAGTSLLFASHTKPFLYLASKLGIGTGQSAIKGINKISNFISDKDIINNNKLVSKLNTGFNKFGIDTSMVQVKNYINGLKSLSTDLGTLSKTSTIEDTIIYLDELNGTIGKANSTNATKILKDLKKNNPKNTDIDKILKSLNDLDYNKIINSNIKLTDNSIKQIIKMTNDLDPKEGKEILKLVETIKNNKGIATKDVNKLSSLLKTYGTKTDDAAAIIKDVSSFSDDFGTLLKNKNNLAALSKTDDLIGSGVAVSTGAGIGFTVASMAIEFLFVYLISSTIQNAIERKLKSLEAIQVFPIFKNGRPLTAGLNGSKGAVVGSAMYNQQGLLQSTIESLTKDHKGFGGKLYDFLIRDTLINDGAKEAVEKWRHNNGFKNDMGSISDIESVSITSDILKDMASDELSRTSSIHSLLLKNRIQSFSSDDGKIAYKKYAYLDPSAVEKDKKLINNFVPLKLSDKINRFKNEKKLIIYHDSNDINNSTIVSQGFDYNGNSIELNCLYQENKTIIDIPVLKQDAFFVLSHILDILNNKLKDDLKNKPILIQSCLRVGDKKSWGSTGFVFKIKVANYNDLFNDLINTKSDTLNFSKTGDGLIGSSSNGIFLTAKQSEKDGYMFFIHPQKK